MAEDGEALVHEELRGVEQVPVPRGEHLVRHAVGDLEHRAQRNAHLLRQPEKLPPLPTSIKRIEFFRKKINDPERVKSSKILHVVRGSVHSQGSFAGPFPESCPHPHRRSWTLPDHATMSRWLNRVRAHLTTLRLLSRVRDLPHNTEIAEQGEGAGELQLRHEEAPGEHVLQPDASRITLTQKLLLRPQRPHHHQLVAWEKRRHGLFFWSTDTH